MTSPDQQLLRYFAERPFRVRRRLVERLQANADRVADAIAANAPVGPTGKTKASVRVRRGRNSLELVVEAGGADTTKPVREGADVDYDYALAGEFGTSKQPARPWFYSTWRAMEDEVRADIEAAFGEAMND